MDAQTVESLVNILPGLIETVALKIGYKAPSQMHRDVMYFLHKYSREITTAFKQHYSESSNRTLNESRSKERIKDWVEDMTDISKSHPNDNSGLPRLAEFRLWTVTEPAFEWLLQRLRREILLYNTTHNAMAEIKMALMYTMKRITKTHISRKESAAGWIIQYQVD
ncbi:hypothetical protein BX600DRAFT_110761 [Xylariales sp. PMI_506]|nr:hypothetical protein BX600DRAFT_110761 [Xylariales sp. PMI_506]